MRKGLYILIQTPSNDDHSGIGLKIRNQIKAFNRAGLNFKEIVLPISESKALPLLYRMPFTNVYPIWNYWNEFNGIDYIYMRRPFVMSGPMRKTFKRIKEKNPNVKIVVEIPTYPYDSEYDTYKAKGLLIAKDKYNRTRMKGLIDRYAVLSGEKEIFGIPTVGIVNGIDVDEVHKRSPKNNKDGTLHICAIAGFKEWHGYERFIEGLKRYYKNGGSRNIVCDFDGEGSALESYKKMVKDNDLDGHFIFYGYVEGKQLDDIYNCCTVSLGSFGMYKINLNLSCNLKSREAVAREIPMITGCPTDIFVEGKFKYYLEFPNDPSVIDIQKIIDFNDGIYKKDERTVINEIRQYAYENVSIDAAMKNVIDFFKS